MEINMVRLKLKKDKIINGLKEIQINAEKNIKVSKMNYFVIIIDH